VAEGALGLVDGGNNASDALRCGGLRRGALVLVLQKVRLIMYFTQLASSVLHRNVSQVIHCSGEIPTTRIRPRPNKRTFTPPNSLQYRDAKKLLCSPCHKACAGSCSGAGPAACER
jgi:hypothetical protein